MQLDDDEIEERKEELFKRLPSVLLSSLVALNTMCRKYCCSEAKKHDCEDCEINTAKKELEKNKSAMIELIKQFGSNS